MRVQNVHQAPIGIAGLTIPPGATVVIPPEHELGVRAAGVFRAGLLREIPDPPASEHKRTAIRRLSVRRYRSLRDVVLENVPDVLVLYGPNGSGKSNILRAAQLLLRAVPLPVEQVASMSFAEADGLLDLRPDDFRFDDLPEIRIALEIELGTRATEILLPPGDRRFSRLSLAGVFELAGGAIRFRHEVANLDDGQVEIGPRTDPLAQIVADMTTDDTGLQLVADRARHTLIPRLLQVSDAYRAPAGASSPEAQLYSSLVSEDRAEREAARRLGRRLGDSRLFGAASGEVALVPVESKIYGERQVRLRHPTHGELPLRNLGTGEQQVVLMLGQRVITPYPIAHLEEPEAHLHTSLMEPFAHVLRESVLGNGRTPDVDQLWMATHHHLFAIAEEFFDVSLDAEGATHVERRKRDEAVKHFYEPHPYWDTLRGLVESGMSPDTIVSVDADGQPIRAQAVLDSIHGDRRIADAFVEAATRAFVLSLTKDEPAK